MTDGASTGMELVVLGSAGTHPGPDAACSGYLVRTERTRLVLDAGNGSTSRLYAVAPLETLDAVVVSHRHPDHCVDLVGMYYALRFHPEGPRSLDVYAPVGTREFLGRLMSDDAAAKLPEVLRFHDVAPGDRVTVGDLELSFQDSPHAVPTVATRVEHAGRVLTYSGDSGGGPGVVEAARDADLFLCEATWLGDPSDWPGSLHLTARGAAQLAEEAGARRLLLTHLIPTGDADESRRQASELFGGPVDVAVDRAVWTVG